MEVVALELIEIKNTGINMVYVYRSNIDMKQTDIMYQYIPNPKIIKMGYFCISMLLTDYEYDMMPLPLYFSIFDDLPPMKTPFIAGTLRNISADY